jgi:glycyl-tRNA synthetase beta chain
LFEHVEENDLYHSVQSLKEQGSQLNALDSELMELLYTMRLPVQNFFEHVFVMSEDSKIRNNRLRLIYEVYVIIHKYFDLSKIVFEGGSAS